MTNLSNIVFILSAVFAAFALLQLAKNAKLKRDNKSFQNIFQHTNDSLLLIDIIDGKIAQQIGMKAGDVIVNLGDFHITDIYNYMAALSTFKKGDATKVSVMRGKDELSFNVTF